MANSAQRKPLDDVDRRTRNYMLASEAERKVARQNAALTEEEFEQVDETVVQVAEERIPVASGLRDRGLTRDLDGLGVLKSTYRAQSDMSPASRSMTGRAVGEGDRPEVDTRSVPVPLIFKDFDFDLRILEASRRFGESFDDSTVRIATRKVAESIEDLVINGDTNIQVAGDNIPGLTGFADRNTINRGTGTNWDGYAIANRSAIITDVIDGIQAGNDVSYFGPWWLIVPGEYGMTLEQDYKAESDDTVRDRLMRIDGLESITVADQLPDNNVLLVQPTSDVIDMVVGEDIDTFVEEEDDREMMIEARVFTALAPRLKSDYNNATGITHITLQD